MLPSSHSAQINVWADDRLADKDAGLHLDSTRAGMRPDDDFRSETELEATTTALLAGGFSEFIVAASRLETSYRALQEEVSALGVELSERNIALHASLTENERMRMALQEIVDSMPCGILVLNNGDEVSVLNPESRRLLGLETEQPFGEARSSLRRISAASGVDLEGLRAEACSTETGRECCIQSAGGKRWLEVRTKRLFRQGSEAHALDQTILILRDITAQKRSEAEREAGRKAMALAEITTILAHEIRNPLASLELFAELIENDTDHATEWISNLRAGIRSLSATVNNVLKFHGASPLRLTPLTLSASIENAIKFVQPLADQAAISLDWIDESDATLIMGNESALQQLVLNLVSNALRYTPAGGKMSIRLRLKEIAEVGARSSYILAEFEDSGCGLRLDQIERIFEPGFSGNGETSGLGLTVCRRIAEQHAGCISAKQVLNAGARFVVEFPVLHEESQAI
jgi:two-component system sensor histidine kinase FlrB